MVAYQTAYLKAHFPTEFMAALLMSDRANADRVAVEIQECNNI
jgi:DNA polymerase-3 subunit alpha